jgi:hypothetical protein
MEGEALALAGIVDRQVDSLGDRSDVKREPGDFRSPLGRDRRI